MSQLTKPTLITLALTLGVAAVPASAGGFNFYLPNLTYPELPPVSQNVLTPLPAPPAPSQE